MGVIFKAGSAHAITLSLFISLSVWLIIVWLYWWPNSLWKTKHESDQAEWERESAFRGLNANADAQFFALPWSFFKMNLGLRANTTFPKRLFTWAGLAGSAEVNFISAITMIPVSRYLDTGRNSSSPDWLSCHAITKLILIALNSRAVVLVKWYAHWSTYSLWRLCWNWGDDTRYFLGQKMLARCGNNSK